MLRGGINGSVSGFDVSSILHMVIKHDVLSSLLRPRVTVRNATATTLFCFSQARHFEGLHLGVKSGFQAGSTYPNLATLDIGFLKNMQPSDINEFTKLVLGGSFPNLLIVEAHYVSPTRDYRVGNGMKENRKCPAISVDLSCHSRYLDKVVKEFREPYLSEEPEDVTKRIRVRRDLEGATLECHMGTGLLLFPSS
ncbi:hypothetical protein M427DRAFT_153883 [Gonapodya prolifera JEL478]|uniref:Uncharacterized protein n=1 Tax=Gonapodya prolifera (strain JEL478) TaxID=1344416 RepID=A0A139ALK6_GONPJ|nr:hypothetical protein M427DRAFT_153883 [Gonapodya prolifera JEL478]|eukprot:KXS17383.1 hypothetical protein M427DRAFT_153883 [Gonapodya prolifera JEL478]